MLMYLLISIFVLGCLGLLLRQIALSHRPSDSVLKQRAIFSPQQQLTYLRLTTLFAEQHILAQVSFDALLTTKYSRTRYKYRNMVADFVLLDQDYQIMAVIALNESQGTKRLKNAYYEDDLLKMAGYKVLRYAHVPEIHELKRDFLNAHIVLDPTQEVQYRDKHFHFGHIPM